jgi:hypothetical protein
MSPESKRVPRIWFYHYDSMGNLIDELTCYHSHMQGARNYLTCMLNVMMGRFYGSLLNTDQFFTVAAFRMEVLRG